MHPKLMCSHKIQSVHINIWWLRL